MNGLPLADIRADAWRSRMLFLSMRLLPWAPVRNLVAPALAAVINARRSTQRSAPLTGEESAMLATLKAEGLANIAPACSERQVSEIVSFLRMETLVARSGARFRPHEAPAGVSTASYPLETVLRCPHVLDLVNRPSMLRLAEEYLGCIPTVSGLRIDWSAPSDASVAYVQQYHRDHDDWRFLKLFVYLTDVDEDGGPHEYVRTSHLGSGRFTRRPYEAAEVEARYGRANISRVTGKSGTSFLADTWGIHKGNVPLSKPRLMLQIQYSLLPVWRYAYHPVALPLRPEYPAYVNRLLIAPVSTAAPAAIGKPAA